MGLGKMKIMSKLKFHGI